MNWSDGFTSTYYIKTIDPKSWREVERIEITGGSIDRSQAELLESADINTTELPGNGEAWVRIWLDARQSGVTHVPLFTGITSAPSRDIVGQRSSYQIECYSVLKPVDDILTERGYYIPAEAPAPQAAARLLRTGIAPVEVENGAVVPCLQESVVAEDGETNLTLAEKVLNAINWRIRIDGYGTIHVESKKESAIKMFDVNKNDVIELQVKDENDWFSCPNVFRAISGDLTAVARDDDPESYLSTVSRGREIWAEETSVNLGTNESLAGYAFRRLRELQSPARTVSYARRFDPGVRVGDVIRLNHPEIGVNGLFRITSQSLELNYGCRTTEEAVLEQDN